MRTSRRNGEQHIELDTRIFEDIGHNTGHYIIIPVFGDNGLANGIGAAKKVFGLARQDIIFK